MQRTRQAQHVSIKQAAAATGLSVDTLRYYERLGLIVHPERTASGRRVYSPAHLEWIGFVVRLRAAGLPLAVIRRYAALVQAGAATLPHRYELLREHERELAARIAELSAAHKEIRDVLTKYRRALRGGPDVCAPLQRRTK